MVGKCIREVGQIEGIDIDEMEDFIMADAIFNYRLKTGVGYFLLRSDYVVPSYTYVRGVA